MTDVIDQQSVHQLAFGAAVLGAGANSFPYVAYLAAREILRERGPVPLISVHELQDSARVALVAMAGAPLPLQERLVDPEHFARPVSLLARHLGINFDAVMAYELGPTNSLIPVMVSARMGLPLVDADTMGRAFPELQMSLFAIEGLEMAPMAASDIRQNDVILAQATSAKWVERIARNVCTTCGSILAICSAYTGLEIKRHGVHGTYARALHLGRTILQAQEEHRSPIEALLSCEAGRVLAEGTIIDVERRTGDGWVRGHAVIGSAGNAGYPTIVRFQNEYTMVESGGRPNAMVPDLIAILDSVKGEPLGTEALRYGQRVTVVRFPPSEKLLTTRALAVVGPRAFGYDFDYDASPA